MEHMTRWRDINNGTAPTVSNHQEYEKICETRLLVQLPLQLYPGLSQKSLSAMRKKWEYQNVVKK